MKSFIALIVSALLVVSIPMNVSSAELTPIPSSPVKVYVLDGGYLENGYFSATSGPDFSKDKGTKLEGLDCDRKIGSFHGNKTSGLIYKYTGESEIEIVSVKIFPCDSEYSNSFWSIYRALNWVASNHPKGELGVVNLSATTGKYGRLLEIPLRKLERLGIPVVVSAGNYGSDACNHYTAKSSRTITVGALDKNFTKIWEKSNTGDCVDYYTGGYHTCVEYDNQLTRCNGTSYAAPVITAKVVNYMYKFPGASLADVKEMLEEEAKSKKIKSGTKTEFISYHAIPRKR